MSIRVQVPKSSTVGSLIKGSPLNEVALNRPWLTFFNVLVTKFSNAEGVAAVASANVAAAPGAYNQAHIDTIVTLVNELKAQVNANNSAMKS